MPRGSVFFACSEALLSRCCQLAQGSRREALLPSTLSGAQILLQKLHKEMWESHASPQKRHLIFMLLQFLAAKTPNLYKEAPEEATHAGDTVLPFQSQLGASQLCKDVATCSSMMVELRLSSRLSVGSC